MADGEVSERAPCIDDGAFTRLVLGENHCVFEVVVGLAYVAVDVGHELIVRPLIM